MISERMKTNISFVEMGSIVADVGCDHGFAAIYLIQKGIAARVIALDINAKPLEKARINIMKEGLTDKIEVRLSDGLKSVGISDGVPEADTAIIAGMGGRLGIKILEDSREKVMKMKRIILQLQSNPEYVRERLSSMGFHIYDEAMTLEDGKYYTTILICPLSDRATKREPTVLKEEELYYGPVLLAEREPLLYQWLIKEEKKFAELMQEITSTEETGIPAANRGKESIGKSLKRIRTALGYYKTGEMYD